MDIKAAKLMMHDNNNLKNAGWRKYDCCCWPDLLDTISSSAGNVIPGLFPNQQVPKDFKEHFCLFLQSHLIWSLQYQMKEKHGSG